MILWVTFTPTESPCDSQTLWQLLHDRVKYVSDLESLASPEYFISSDCCSRSSFCSFSCSRTSSFSSRRLSRCRRVSFWEVKCSSNSYKHKMHERKMHIRKHAVGSRMSGNLCTCTSVIPVASLMRLKASSAVEMSFSSSASILVVLCWTSLLSSSSCTAARCTCTMQQQPLHMSGTWFHFTES